jgi:hypothetical protein
MSEVIARRPAECLSDLALDRLLAGEPGPRWDHVNSCVRCRARIDELKQASRLSDLWIQSGIARTRRRLRNRRVAAVTSLAVAAVLVLAAVKLRPLPVVPHEAPQDSRADSRLKGSALSLGVYVRRGSGAVVAAQSPAAVAPGEQIRFEVTSARPGYLGIVGLDAAGAVTPYVSSGQKLRRLGAGRQLLDGSILLDDTLGAERLIAVFCPSERDTRDVVAAAQAALDEAGRDATRVESLALGCEQASFLLQKSK